MSFESDPLISIKQLFHTSSYTALLREAPSLEPSAELSSYVARSLLAFQPARVEEAIAEVSKYEENPACKSVSLLASHLSGLDVVSELKELQFEHEEDPVVKVIAATVLYRSGETEEALLILGAGTDVDSGEVVSMIIQIYLLMNRSDLATSTLTRAKSQLEDSPALQAAEAWISLTSGSGNSAYYILDEFVSLPGSSTAFVAQNARAVALASTHEWKRAQSALLEAGNGSEQQWNARVIGGYLGEPMGIERLANEGSGMTNYEKIENIFEAAKISTLQAAH